MKESSVATLISLNSSKKQLEDILENMIDIVESDLWISVEDCYSDNSYWMPTPKSEIDDCWDVIGIIEIDVNTDEIGKIISLTHEVGHYFLDQDGDFGGDNHTMFTDIIDMNVYKEEAHKCLSQYVRSLNEEENS